ncbi:MAG: hypothetical protein B7X56_06880, partial [Burkholderiales bacterium 34-67-9]
MSGAKSRSTACIRRRRPQPMRAPPFCRRCRCRTRPRPRRGSRATRSMSAPPRCRPRRPRSTWE